MELQIRRLGGIAGVRLRHRLETAELPRGEGEQVERLVRRLAGKAPAAPPRPDAFRYEIQAPGEPTLAPIVLDEHEVPSELRGVIRAAVEAGEIER